MKMQVRFFRDITLLISVFWGKLPLGKSMFT